MTFIENAKQSLLHFLDGNGYDKLLQSILRGLFFIMICFCLPYFCYVLFSLLL
ncbi:hypothetical protein J2S19_000141 [Metabacillus malikii]|uniref:Uncharacterized protein n=1 Tax=Metabacillus malikii TaxID=1504265 RepID=A0ABT9ZAM7_9BACI|nr:hypothetical protein [Metabacillus malikii]